MDEEKEVIQAEEKPLTGREKSLANLKKPHRTLGNDAQSKIAQSRGGKATAEKKRKLKALKDATREFLKMDAMGSAKDMTRKFGYSKEDTDNLAAILARLFMLAMKGDKDAIKMLMDYAGISPDELRKEDENKRKNAESAARIEAMKNGQVDGITSGEDGGDVHIYMPEIDEIKDEGKNSEEIGEQK